MDSQAQMKTGARSSGDDETRVYMLLRAVEENPGMTLTDEWVLTAHKAKQLGYLSERDLRLDLTSLGQQWLAVKHGQEDPNEFTMVKLTRQAKLDLKGLARGLDSKMQDTIAGFARALYEERERIAAFAFRKGLEHPWDAITPLLDAARVKAPGED